jgi:hypothetical protein
MNLKRLTARAFKSTGVRQENALRVLDEIDRYVLVTLLLQYDDSEFVLRETEPFEKASITIAEALRVAKKLKAQVFQGVCSDFLPRGADRSRERLEELTEYLEAVRQEWANFGGPGAKADVVASHWLVIALEFVRLRTGAPHYEDLSDLFQQISRRSLPPSGELLSGDAIRHRESRLKKQYPVAYQEALRQARMCSRPSEPDEQDWMFSKRRDSVESS